MLADAEALRNLRNRIASFRDLTNSLNSSVKFDLLMMLFLPQNQERRCLQSLGLFSPHQRCCA